MPRFVLLVAAATSIMSPAEAQPQKPKPAVRATAADSLKVAPGFQAELLYSVPQAQFGSWVNLCVDPKGRLIVSDQYGLLYRVTPPAVGADLSKSTLTIEPLPPGIGEAQGMCWAFDALYVVVNSGRRPSGLYRISSTGNNDKLDRVEFLKAIDPIPGHGGGGEHGPHAVIPHPDGKRLTVVCGNQCKLVQYTSTKVPPVWGEDLLLPRMPDGRGFMAGVLAPGGCIYHVSPDGKDWELFSTGYRNPYDAAYHASGDLFTYDADMEWDLNTPWYRPTRICKVASGSDFGWRNGAGKFPPFYADNLPGVLDIGPGSPTGMCFGYGSKFPAKYRNALFICDWSYGKMYAVHLNRQPGQCDFQGEFEEFISGTPLPLTDVAINAVDGAMYFIIGGRKTQSGLYRITAKEPVAGGNKPNEPSQVSPESNLGRLMELERLHGTRATAAELETILATCNHENRSIRYAARTALEHQPVQLWSANVLDAQSPSDNALLALVRCTATCPQHRNQAHSAPVPIIGGRILDRLNSVDFGPLSRDQRLEHIRVYHVLFNRYGQPSAEGRTEALKKFEAAFPTGDRFVDGEIAQLLVYLESPLAAAKIVELLENAPTQEEQIEYGRSLRVLKSGWTPDLRARYFRWLQTADGYRGGMSFGGFLKTIRDDAIRTLSASERAALGSLIQPAPNAGAAKQQPRPLVKEYSMEELLPAVERDLKSGRDYDRGRRMFAAAQCAACHRFDGEGGASGPDLTQVAGRFSARDLLESIIDPDKEVSDQYAATEFLIEDGRKITGRIVNLDGDDLVVLPNMLEPSATLRIKRKHIESMKSAKQSMMPAGTLNTLRKDEILDLMAYLLSRGNRQSPMFAKP